MSHFRELPDVVLPKIAQKLKKNQSNSQDLAKITDFRFTNFGELQDVVLTKIVKKTYKPGSCGFWHYQMWISQKLPNFYYLTAVF